MIYFHNGKISEKEPDTPTKKVNIGSFLLEPMNDDFSKYHFTKNLFIKNNNDQLLIDSHLLDVILPKIKDLDAVIFYLYLKRWSDKNFLVTDLDSLAYKTFMNKTKILACLALLEEFYLIKIEGSLLLKITLNEKWF